MQKLYTGMAVIVMVLAGMVSAYGQQMQTYTSTDAGFTVRFPQAEVQTGNQKLFLKGGGTTTLYQYYVKVDNNNVAYMVMHFDYPEDYTNGDPQTALATVRDSAVGSKPLLSDIAINLNGVPGREFTTKDDKMNYTSRLYLRGKRLYQLIVFSNRDHPATQTSEFLDSFKIF